MTNIHRLQCVACMTGVLLSTMSLRADDWPQWRGLHRDGVWAEKGIREKFPTGGLKIRWRVPLGSGYSSPVIAGGRVFVTDCVLGPKEKLRAKEQVHCFDEATGKRLWTYGYDAAYPDFAWPPNDDFGGPIATPIVQDGKLYTVGAVGNLYCLDIQGRDLWKKDLAQGYGIGGDFCRTGSPLIEGNLLIVQTACLQPKAGIVAFDKESGKEMWHALDAYGYYNSPLVIAAGGKRQLIVVNDGWVTSLDPVTGKTYWKEKFAVGRNIPTPVFSKDRLLVNGLMFRLDADKPSATVLWPERKPDAYLSDTTTAIVVDDLVFSHKRPDRLVCMDADTGKLLWETDKVRSSMHSLTRCRDGFFVFTDQGTLIRARISARSYEEVSRTPLIKPTTKEGKSFKVYAAPSYANGHVFARNDEELICASLAAEP
jgi:outer membrane protein assembly factor BamB